LDSLQTPTRAIMNTLLRQSINPLRSSRPLRQFATALPRRREAYVPTINNIIPPSNTIQISALVPAGFHLSNDVVIPGAAILLSGRAYLWNVELPTKEDDGGVRAWAGWGPDAFRVFEAVAPRPGTSDLDLGSPYKVIQGGTGPTLNRFAHSIYPCRAAHPWDRSDRPSASTFPHVVYELAWYPARRHEFGQSPSLARLHATDHQLLTAAPFPSCSILGR
jgi:hypothetical protein